MLLFSLRAFCCLCVIAAEVKKQQQILLMKKKSILHPTVLGGGGLVVSWWLTSTPESSLPVGHLSSWQCSSWKGYLFGIFWSGSGVGAVMRKSNGGQGRLLGGCIWFCNGRYLVYARHSYTDCLIISYRIVILSISRANLPRNWQTSLNVEVTTRGPGKGCEYIGQLRLCIACINSNSNHISRNYRCCCWCFYSSLFLVFVSLFLIFIFFIFLYFLLHHLFIYLFIYLLPSYNVLLL